jgi:hypothetical protein
LPYTALQALEEQRPELRLRTYGLPPITVTEIEPSISTHGGGVNGLFEYLLSWLQERDPELFSVHTDAFLKAPHIIVPLLSHLASLSAEENLKFPVQLKRLSDHFRFMLESDDTDICIQKVERNHLDTWATAQGKRYAYLDGGVAKIAGLPGSEPTALRVGIYSVRAGEQDLSRRENWDLQPFVVGDIIDKNTGVHLDDDDQINLRRLGEAARYVLEPLAGMRFIESNPDTSALFLQGPLVNQFVMYDEGEPNFIPFLREDFLKKVGIQLINVEGLVKDIPSKAGKKMWRQFMAVYGYVMASVHGSETPILGVVERSAGSWIAGAVLESAVRCKLISNGRPEEIQHFGRLLIRLHPC